MTPALTGLRAIEPVEAELRQGVIAALTGRRTGDALLMARIAPRSDDRGGWLTCANGAAVAFDRIDGQAERLPVDDGLAAVALIERAEALLREIESALGIDLDPLAVAAAPPADTLIVEVVGQDGARPLHALRLAIPRALALLPQPAPFAPGLAGRAALAATITLEGPRIAPHDAADLGAGDCILLGSGPLAATLSLGELIRIPGRIDPARPQFVSTGTDVMEKFDG